MMTTFCCRQVLLALILIKMAWQNWIMHTSSFDLRRVGRHLMTNIDFLLNKFPSYNRCRFPQMFLAFNRFFIVEIICINISSQLDLHLLEFSLTLSGFTLCSFRQIVADLALNFIQVMTCSMMPSIILHLLLLQLLLHRIVLLLLLLLSTIASNLRLFKHFLFHSLKLLVFVFRSQNIHSFKI